MEALASKTAIARRVNKAVRKGLPTMLGDKIARRGGRLKSGDLADAVGARDLVALHSTDPASVFLSAWARLRDPGTARSGRGAGAIPTACGRTPGCWRSSRRTWSGSWPPFPELER